MLKTFDGITEREREREISGGVKRKKEKTHTHTHQTGFDRLIDDQLRSVLMANPSGL